MSELFAKEIMDELAASGEIHNTHTKLTEALLRHAHKRGMTLEACCNPLFMNRSISTLQRRVRQIGDMSFPDYVPRKLRPKKEKPPKKPRGKKNGQE